MSAEPWTQRSWREASPGANAVGADEVVAGTGSRSQPTTLGTPYELDLQSVLISWYRSPPENARIAAAFHAADACPGTRCLDLDGSFDLGRDRVTEGFVVEDGCLRLLDRPGLGVDLS
jgi:hypothetical protein